MCYLPSKFVDLAVELISNANQIFRLRQVLVLVPFAGWTTVTFSCVF